MSGVRSGSLTGGDALERARTLAGALAELGITELVLEQGNATRTIRSGGTDLPGILSAARGRTVVRCPNTSLVIEVREGSLRWRTTNLKWAEHLSSLGPAGDGRAQHTHEP